MILSLRNRLLFSALLVLLLFTSLTGLVLDNAFRQSARSALEDKLRGQMFALLAAMDLDEKRQPYFSRPLADERFAQPDSGLYAHIQLAGSNNSLATQSLLGKTLPTSIFPETGKEKFSQITLDKIPVYRLDYTIRWITEDNQNQTIYFSLLQDTTSYEQQLHSYRQNLWSWLGGATFILLVLQTMILHWGLRPLRTVTHELEQIEKGELEKLQSNYPRELRQLTQKINDLLNQARLQLERYRDALGNMAHSLKTPLSILSNEINPQDNNHPEANEQLERIRQIIDYQLQRATTAGKTSLTKPIALKPVIEKILSALNKVYHDRNIQATLHCSDDITYAADEGDLMEVFGNLMENAFKWANSKIVIHIEQSSGEKYQLQICIEDDGPGIKNNVRDRIKHRGERADTTTAGHGIGLAMVQEIVLLYGGVLEIGNSKLGGALIRIQLA